MWWLNQNEKERAGQEWGWQGSPFRGDPRNLPGTSLCMSLLLPTPWSPFFDLKDPGSQRLVAALFWVSLSPVSLEDEAESPWLLSKKTSQTSSSVSEGRPKSKHNVIMMLEKKSQVL